jgi:hypothetical protein
MSRLTAIPNFDCLYKSKSGSFYYSVQSKSRKPSGDFRRNLIKLRGDNVADAVKDIRKRKLFQEFNNLSKKEKFAKIRALEASSGKITLLRKCADRLIDNAELFAWGGFRGIKCQPSQEINSLLMKGRKIYFNPSWISVNSDINIIRKLRSFVK